MAKEIRKKQRTRRGPSKPKFGASSDRKLSAGRDERSEHVEEQPPNLQFLKRYQGTLAEIIRGSDLVVLNAALNFLFTRLREARRQFEQEGDAGRLGAFTALGALWQFVVLFEKPSSQSLQTPILRLQDALVSLDKNSVLPIVAPTKRRGRGESSHAHLALKGHVAGTVRRLISLGAGQADALEKVAAMLRRLGVRAERGSGQVTARTIRNWCNEVSTDVSRKGTAAQVFHDMFADAEEKRFASLSQADARRFALVSLSSWVERLFPELKKAT